MPDQAPVKFICQSPSRCYSFENRSQRSFQAYKLCLESSNTGAVHISSTRSQPFAYDARRVHANTASASPESHGRAAKERKMINADGIEVTEGPKIEVLAKGSRGEGRRGDKKHRAGFTRELETSWRTVVHGRTAGVLGITNAKGLQAASTGANLLTT